MMNKMYIVYDKNENDVCITCDYKYAIEILENNKGGFIEVINANTGNVDEVIKENELCGL